MPIYSRFSLFLIIQLMCLKSTRIFIAIICIHKTPAWRKLTRLFKVHQVFTCSTKVLCNNKGMLCRRCHALNGSIHFLLLKDKKHSYCTKMFLYMLRHQSIMCHWCLYRHLCDDELPFVWNVLFCTCKWSLFLTSLRYLTHVSSNSGYIANGGKY